MWWLLYVHLAGVATTLFSIVAIDSYQGGKMDNYDMGTAIMMSIFVWPLLILLFSAEAFGKTLKERKERRELIAKEERTRLHEVDRLLLEK